MIVVEVDWERNGFGGFTYDSPYTDIYSDTEDGGTRSGTDTDWVRPNAQPITVEYGRDQTSAPSPTVAGRGGSTLGNETRRYSPRNASSELYGYLKPARPVKITRTADGEEGGEEYGEGEEYGGYEGG